MVQDLIDGSEFSNVTEVTFERGAQLYRTKSGGWKYRSKSNWEYIEDIDEFGTGLELKPVRFVLSMPDGLRMILTLSRFEVRPPFQVQVQLLAESVIDRDKKYFHDIRNLSYIAAATAYHCHQLIDRYLDVIKAAKDFGPPDDIEDFTFGGAVDPYYEFEALVTAVIRGYETARYPLWRRFGTSGPAPRNFELTVRQMDIPSDLQPFFEEAKSLYVEAKHYRDCIQHNAHFGARLPFARIRLHKDKIWTANALLPDNPETKAYGRFTFDQSIDALSYGWLLTDRLFVHLGAIVGQIPERTSNEHLSGQ